MSNTSMKQVYNCLLISLVDDEDILHDDCEFV